MKHSFGFIDFIHSYPLNGAFRLNKIDPCAHLSYETPKVLATLLKAQKLDGAFISLTDYLEGDFLPTSYGIAAEKSILSVNLYLKKERLHDGARIGVTPLSRTSILLLKILCHYFWRVTPLFETLDRARPFSAYDGVLLIGDEALKQLIIPEFITYDLADLWYQYTQLPFVFALLALQKETKATPFLQKIGESLEFAKSHPQKILSLAQEKTGLPEDLIQKYYTLCHFVLDERHHTSITLFKKLAYGILSLNSRIDPIPF